MPWWVSILLILSSLAAAGFALRLWFVAWARWRSASRRTCPECDHDLRATTGATCPECGFTDGADQRRRLRRRNVGRVVAGALLIMSATFTMVLHDRVRHNGWMAVVPRELVVVLLWTTNSSTAFELLPRGFQYGAGLHFEVLDELRPWERRLIRAGGVRRLRSGDPGVREVGLWMLAIVSTDSELMTEREWVLVESMLDDPESEIARSAFLIAGARRVALQTDPRVLRLFGGVQPESVIYGQLLLPMFEAHLTGVSIGDPAPPSAGYIRLMDAHLTSDTHAGAIARRSLRRAAGLGHRLDAVVDRLINAAATAPRPGLPAEYLSLAWLHSDTDALPRVIVAIEAYLATDPLMESETFHEVVEDPRCPAALLIEVRRRQLQRDCTYTRHVTIARLGLEDDAILEPLAPLVIDAAAALDPEWASLESVQAIVQRAHALVERLP